MCASRRWRDRTLTARAVRPRRRAPPTGLGHPVSIAGAAVRAVRTRSSLRDGVVEASLRSGGGRCFLLGPLRRAATLAALTSSSSFRPFTACQFWRTIAWQIANRPFGKAAGMIQYRHASVAAFEGFAGSSNSGFRAQVEAQRKLGQLDDLLISIAGVEASPCPVPRGGAFSAPSISPPPTSRRRPP